LEEISYEIHERRKLRKYVLGTRGIGVGAEACSEESPKDSTPDLVAGLQKLELDSDGAPQPIPWFCRSSSRAGSERETDCSSVASGDTLDTLDDNAIENLMLETTLDTEFRDIFVNK